MLDKQYISISLGVVLIVLYIHQSLFNNVEHLDNIKKPKSKSKSKPKPKSKSKLESKPNPEVTNITLIPTIKEDDMKSLKQMLDEQNKLNKHLKKKINRLNRKIDDYPVLIQPTVIIPEPILPLPPVFTPPIQPVQQLQQSTTNSNQMSNDNNFMIGIILVLTFIILLGLLIIYSK